MMCKRQIFSALVFGFVLAITGCGDDATSGGGTGGSGTAGTGGSGTAGTGGSGTAGTGGSGTAGTGGNGAPVSSCDALCAGSCEFAGIDPDSPNCATVCTEITEPDGQLDDDCGPQMADWVACAESQGCDFVELSCGTEIDAWDDCSDVVIEP